MPSIGVAIAVPEPFGEQLRNHRASFGDDQASAVPSHVTLLPPVDVGSDEVADIDRHLAATAVRHGPFDIHLRGTGTFRPVSPVVFVALASGISACELLASSVRTGPLSHEMQFPYHPHVTVAHHLADDLLDAAFEKLADYECRFRVTAFALYGHEEGAGWQVRREYPLARDARP